MLGISPKHQGKGMGRMLMRIISALADQDAYPVHLEVSGSRNRAYFEQCGFRTMETIDVCSEVGHASLFAQLNLCVGLGFRSLFAQLNLCVAFRLLANVFWSYPPSLFPKIRHAPNTAWPRLVQDGPPFVIVTTCVLCQSPH
jgi:hypothetical protein